MTTVTLPHGMLEHFSNGQQQDFSITETKDGYRVIVNDPEVERQLAAAIKVMDEYEQTLLILAK